MTMDVLPIIYIGQRSFERATANAVIKYWVYMMTKRGCLATKTTMTRLCTHPNRTHMFPYRDSIFTDSAATNITETDSDNNQQPVNLVFK